MKDYHINIFYSDADKGYIADIPDLESCSAFGKTPAEALRQAQLARRFGWKPPVPRANRFPVLVPAHHSDRLMDRLYEC